MLQTVQCADKLQQPLIQAKLWSRIDVQRSKNACWPFRGPNFLGGYGRIHLAGRQHMAHRAVWISIHGDPPKGWTVDHLCHEAGKCTLVEDCPHRACCNPAHLLARPHQENLLRGNTFVRHNANATHCINGHEFTPENTRIDPKPRVQGYDENGDITWRMRVCRQCDRERKKAAYDEYLLRVAACSDKDGHPNVEHRCETCGYRRRKWVPRPRPVQEAS